MEEQLIFLLVPETRWGNYIIQPARVKDNGEFYSYLGQFTDDLALSPDEKAIIRETRKYEPAALYKTYGRKKFKTEKDFVNSADDELLPLIKTYVDKTVAGIISQIATAALPLYLRESRLDNPHKKDRIVIEPEALKVHLGFYRNEENIRYRLGLSSREKHFLPSQYDLKTITAQPGIILIGNRLFHLPEGFGALRLKPFLRKEEVIIPRQSEQMYFRQFILKNIGNADIEAEGFDIIERDTKKSAWLSVERDLSGEPVFELCFRYNNRVVPSYSKAKVIVELEETDGQYCFYKTSRHRQWERDCVQLLEATGLCVTSSGFLKMTEHTADWYALVEWIHLHAKSLLAKGIEIKQDKLATPYYIGGWKLDYRQQTNVDWFELHATICLDDGRTIPLQALWQHILTGKREYRLKDNTVFVIPEEWFSRYSAIMLFGERKENEVVLHKNQFNLLDDRKTLSVDSFAADAPVEVPRGLKATLRDYQLRGYRWLYHLYRQKMGACLADDMGLGKTVQTIALLLKYKEEAASKAEVRKETSLPAAPLQLSLFDAPPPPPPSNEAAPEQEGEAFCTCLIVAPASVTHNWRNELHKFAPSLLVAEYVGIGRTSMKVALMRWDVVITTYQTLRNDINFLKKKEFGIVVFDESQSFKNRDSQVYQAVTQINCRRFIALSGTPIENSLSDLWSLMSVINRGLLGSHATFNNYFIKPITVDVNSIHSESLRQLIQPFILRRTKEEVLEDLPERTDELIICDPDPEQQRLYDEELSKARNKILENKLLPDGGKRETFGSLQAIIRLRQMANHPRMAESDYTGSSGKFREIFRMLEEIYDTGHKVLLFSDYVKYLDLVAEEMNQRSWEYAMLTGATVNREEVINRFSTRPDCRFFLISLKAGGVGLNLTEADYVFILDPWWNLAAEEQAISRAHRMGQKRAVFVYRFVTAGTLEEKILRIQQQKQDISDAIIVTDQPNAEQMENLILGEE